MSQAFPYVSVAPGLIEWKHIRRMGPSPLWLFLFLVHYQRRPDGLVNGGTPITYRWIAEKLHAPRTAERSLRKWMRILKRGAYVRVRILRWGGGMVVSIVEQKKWQGHSSQNRLFPREEPMRMPRTRTRASVSNPVEKPVEKPEIDQVLGRPNEDGPVPRIGTLKDLRIIRGNNKIAATAASAEVDAVEKLGTLELLASIARAKSIAPTRELTPREIDARRRFLLDQVEECKKKQVNGSG